MPDGGAEVAPNKKPARGDRNIAGAASATSGATSSERREIIIYGVVVAICTNPVPAVVVHAASFENTAQTSLLAGMAVFVVPIF